MVTPLQRATILDDGRTWARCPLIDKDRTARSTAHRFTGGKPSVGASLAPPCAAVVRAFFRAPVIFRSSHPSVLLQMILPIWTFLRTRYESPVLSHDRPEPRPASRDATYSVAPAESGRRTRTCGWARSSWAPSGRASRVRRCSTSRART
jgi:hypothetical protein